MPFIRYLIFEEIWMIVYWNEIQDYNFSFFWMPEFQKSYRVLKYCDQIQPFLLSSFIQFIIAYFAEVNDWEETTTDEFGSDRSILYKQFNSVKGSVLTMENLIGQEGIGDRSVPRSDEDNKPQV